MKKRLKLLLITVLAFLSIADDMFAQRRGGGRGGGGMRGGGMRRGGGGMRGGGMRRGGGGMRRGGVRMGGARRGFVGRPGIGRRGFRRGFGGRPGIGRRGFRRGFGGRRFGRGFGRRGFRRGFLGRGYGGYPYHWGYSNPWWHYYGLYGPGFGAHLGLPSYEPSYTEWTDNRGYRYWEIRNETGAPIEISGPRDTKTIEPGQARSLDHAGSFYLTIRGSGRRIRARRTSHYLTVLLDKQGRLRIVGDE